MRKTKAEAALTREQVLRAALEVFRRQGYAASTLDDIAAAAGLTRGAIYWHFRGKADLYRTLVEEGFARAGVPAQGFAVKDAPVHDAVGHFIRTSLIYVEDDELYQGVIELTLFQSGPLPNQREGGPDKWQATQALVQALTTLLRDGQQREEVRPEVDPSAAALTLVALVNGAILLWFQGNKTFSLPTLGETLVDTALRGLLT
jgi:TetR/AcrR family acrAB operon transcriptional repressor